jgi:hypothetical protein
MPDDNDSHDPILPLPPLPGHSFGAKLSAMAGSAMAGPAATGAVDLTDLDMWARGVPYDEFARLRREAPVAWHDEASPAPGARRRVPASRRALMHGGFIIHTLNGTAPGHLSNTTHTGVSTSAVSASRGIFAMAGDRRIPAPLAIVSRRHRSPLGAAVFLIGAAAATLP